MASVVASELLAAQLELADALRAGKDTMFDPQDLEFCRLRVSHHNH
jgi:hypothetical protein